MKSASSSLCRPGRLILFTWLCCLLLFSASVLGWDTEDHEIFDLVSALEAAEGKGTTFYKFLNLSKGATLSEINKAARKLSLSLHPDKHPGDKKAEERFARLSVITAILRDEEKRKRYNFFHDNGVPRWKGTGYMYSRWQPGLGFALCFILGVSTLMQYAAQHVNYRSELKRIKTFQIAAKQAAQRIRGEKSQSQGRKKVKISIGKSLAGDGEATGADADIPAPKSRQERRRMQQATGSSGSAAGKGQSGWIDMVVEGDDVWIVAEDGSELPLNESAASKPAFQRTFIPATFYRMFGRFLPTSVPPPEVKPVAEEAVESGDQSEGDEATAETTGLAGKDSKPAQTRSRKGGKSKK